MRSSVPIIGVVRGEKFYQSCVCLYDDGLICLWVISSTGDNNILIEGISHLPIVEDRDASTLQTRMGGCEKGAFASLGLVM